MEDIIYQRNERIVKKCYKEINGKKELCVLKENLNNPFEAEMMIYIKNNTNIPVPKVFDYGKKKENNYYILMEFIEGDTLEKVIGKISDSEKESIINQLGKYIYEMREHNFKFICSINNNPCNELFVDDNLFGPFNTLEEFNNYRIEKLIIDDKIFEDYLNKSKKFKTNFILSHNDIGPYNIIVKNNKIVSILDWELSGFYPDYWEYNRTHFHSGYSNEWKEIIKNFIETPCIKIINFEKIMYCLSIYSNIYNEKDIRETYKNRAKEIINENENLN